MKALVIVTTALVLSSGAIAQEQNTTQPIMEEISHLAIPTYPESYSANLVAARVVDGLWFRFYWATEGLRPEDLDFRPGPEVRTTEETVEHILGMTRLLVNATLGKINEGPGIDYSGMTFEKKREMALANIKQAGDILKESTAEDMESFRVVFKNDLSTREYPFWNLLNGPIVDCIWHCGQIVSFRRSSGNPYNNKASMFAGRLRDE